MDHADWAIFPLNSPLLRWFTRSGRPELSADEPYDTVANRTASIGEYGCDVTSGTIYPPRDVKDFMSYCGPQWISLYHMQRLINHQRLNPTIVSGSQESLPPYFDEQYHGPSIFDRPDPPPPWVGRRVGLVREPNPVRLIVVTGMLRSDHIEILSVMRLRPDRRRMVSGSLARSSNCSTRTAACGRARPCVDAYAGVVRLL